MTMTMTVTMTTTRDAAISSECQLLRLSENITAILHASGQPDYLVDSASLYAR